MVLTFIARSPEIGVAGAEDTLRVDMYMNARERERERIRRKALLLILLDVPILVSAVDLVLHHIIVMDSEVIEKRSYNI